MLRGLEKYPDLQQKMQAEISRATNSRGKCSGCVKATIIRKYKLELQRLQERDKRTKPR